MEKKIAISQSNYIPWKGYFDMISYVDEFILYDDMQYTKRDWRNRNKIKTSDECRWLTIPVKVKGKYYQKIRNTEIDGSQWKKKHWGSIQQNYKKSPFFNEISNILKPLYDKEHYLLSECNEDFIRSICNYLSIDTIINSSSEYELIEGKSEKLLNICLQAGATEYVSGPAAKDYLDEKIFIEAGIKVTWFSYDNYPEYKQLWGDFNHYLSIIDLLFNQGKDSYKFMKFVR
ncbi:WbqC family protein [Vibrio sp. TRT 21S02]|uniref:WbqC family protein n=1 Tax=Vibrio sp. TRT 21S02 TaxID=3418507 RepID=UPI003CF41A56